MTDLDEMKSVIVATVRDEELAMSACYAAEAYVRRWPVVLMVTDWDIWNKGKSALKREVVRWLEDVGTSHDIYLFSSGGGLVAFQSESAALQFKLRWSGQVGPTPSEALFNPQQEWNPHPVKSTFEPQHLDAA